MRWQLVTAQELSRLPPLRESNKSAEDPAIGDVTQRVRKVIGELLGASIDSARDDADFVDDLGADSLDCLELVMGLEKEFGIEIPDEDVEKLKTIRQMVEYVVGRQKARMATS